MPAFLKTVIENGQKIRHDRVFIWTSRASLLILAVCFFALLISWGKLPPQVPLYYSLPWGEEQLGTPASLILLTLGGFLLLVLNTFIAVLVYVRSAYFARLLLVSSTIISLLITTTIIQIMLKIT